MTIPIWAGPRVTGMPFEHGVAMSGVNHLYPLIVRTNAVYLEKRWPDAVMIAQVGKPIRSVVSGHENVDRAFLDNDIVTAVRWDHIHGCTVLEIERDGITA